MEHHVFKYLDIVGTSGSSMEDAVDNAVSRAAATIRHMRWFEVVETRGLIDEGRVVEWQVTLRIGFNLEAPED